MSQVYILDLPIEEAVNHLFTVSKKRFDAAKLRTVIMQLFVKNLYNCTDQCTVNKRFLKKFNEQINESNEYNIKITYFSSSFDTVLVIICGDIKETISINSSIGNKKINLSYALSNAEYLKNTRVKQLHDISPRTRNDIETDYTKLNDTFMAFVEQYETFTDDYPELRYEVKANYTRNQKTGDLIYLSHIRK